MLKLLRLVLAFAAILFVSGLWSGPDAAGLEELKGSELTVKGAVVTLGPGYVLLESAGPARYVRIHSIPPEGMELMARGRRIEISLRVEEVSEKSSSLSGPFAGFPASFLDKGVSAHKPASPPPAAPAPEPPLPAPTGGAKGYADKVGAEISVNGVIKKISLGELLVAWDGPGGKVLLRVFNLPEASKGLIRENEPVRLKVRLTRVVGGQAMEGVFRGFPQDFLDSRASRLTQPPVKPALKPGPEKPKKAAGPKPEKAAGPKPEKAAGPKPEKTAPGKDKAEAKPAEPKEKTKAADDPEAIAEKYAHVGGWGDLKWGMSAQEAAVMIKARTNFVLAGPFAKQAGPGCGLELVLDMGPRKAVCLDERPGWSGRAYKDESGRTRGRLFFYEGGLAACQEIAPPGSEPDKVMSKLEKAWGGEVVVKEVKVDPEMLRMQEREIDQFLAQQGLSAAERAQRKKNMLALLKRSARRQGSKVFRFQDQGMKIVSNGRETFRQDLTAVKSLARTEGQ